MSGWDATSGLASVTVSVNGGPLQSSATLSSDGVYTVAYGAFDNAGIVASYSPKNISVDVTPPILDVNIFGTQGNNGWYVSPAIITASSTDDTSGAGTVVISDNGGAGQESPVTLGNGVHDLTITATDKAGNHKTVSQMVYVDMQKPSILPSVTGLLGNNDWYISAVDVSASVSDILSGAQGGVDISLDNGESWSSQPLHLSEGIHALGFRANDKAGNLATSSLTIKIDTTPPSFTSATVGTAGNAGWHISDATTIITSSDAMSDIDHVEHNQNGQGWQNGNSITSNDGVNAISIRVYDIAGNVSSESLEIKVDTIAPIVTPVVVVGAIIVFGALRNSG